MPTGEMGEPGPSRSSPLLKLNVRGMVVVKILLEYIEEGRSGRRISEKKRVVESSKPDGP